MTTHSPGVSVEFQMRISTTSNATPQSTPPSSAGSRGGRIAAGDEQFIWRLLVPRLVHPVRLQIVEALIDKGSPMTVKELASLIPLVNTNVELVRYHVKAMTGAGALEAAEASQAQAEGTPAESTFFFALPK